MKENPNPNPPPMPSQEEVEAWVKAEFDKDGDITWDEVVDAVTAWAESHDYTVPAEVWDVLKAGFDAVDANGDGAVTKKELMAAMEKYKPKQEMVQLTKQIASKLIQTKQVPELTEDQLKEIEEWVLDMTTISWKELKKGVKQFAKKHGLGKPDKEFWKWLKAEFKKADTDGNGLVDLGEIKAAV